MTWPKRRTTEPAPVYGEGKPVRHTVGHCVQAKRTQGEQREAQNGGGIKGKYNLALFHKALLRVHQSQNLSVSISCRNDAFKQNLFIILYRIVNYNFVAKSLEESGKL